MNRKTKPTTLSSISDLVQILKSLHKDTKQIWFRGHSNAKWKLIPSLLRKKKFKNSEVNLINRFKQNAVFLSPDTGKTEWDWLFLMQHHRLPTRLLDWSENPLVGLYFAVNENNRKDGCLWCLFPENLNQEAGWSHEKEHEIPFFEERLEESHILNNYLPSKKPTKGAIPIAAIAPRSNDRLYAQMGVFTISNPSSIPIENISGKKPLAKKFIIPYSQKKLLNEELRNLRVTKLTLFPELDNVAEFAKENSL